MLKPPYNDRLADDKNRSIPYVKLHLTNLLLVLRRDLLTLDNF